MGGLCNALNRKLKLTQRQIYALDNISANNSDSLKLSLAVCYFSPLTELETIVADISDCLEKCKHKELIIIGGDFNCRIDAGERGKHLCEIQIDVGFTCLNDITPTYISDNGSSTIDLFFSIRVSDNAETSCKSKIPC